MTGREKGERAADSDSVYQPFDTSCSLPFPKIFMEAEYGLESLFEAV